MEKLNMYGWPEVLLLTDTEAWWDAIRGNNINVVKTCIARSGRDKEGNIKYINKTGWSDETSLDVAVKLGHHEIANLLRQNGAKRFKDL